MTQAEKHIQDLSERLRYIEDIFGNRENANVALLRSKLDDLINKQPGLSWDQLKRQLASLEELFTFL
ncbi:MAG: hypothetical protein ACOCV7_02700, partial [Desulfonatronovibrionaceae bacterium]